MNMESRCKMSDVVGCTIFRNKHYRLIRVSAIHTNFVVVSFLCCQFRMSGLCCVLFQVSLHLSCSLSHISSP